MIVVIGVVYPIFNLTNDASLSHVQMTIMLVTVQLLVVTDDRYSFSRIITNDSANL